MLNVGQPPVGTPPVGTPPVGTPPVGTPPVGTTPTTDPTTTTPPPMLPPPNGGTTTSGTLATADTFTQISGLVGSGLGGGIGTLKSIGNLKLIGQGMKGTEIPSGLDDGETTKIGGGLGSKIKGMSMGAKELGGTALTGAKYGAIIGGAVSALSNGYQVLSGKKSGGDAIGTFAADTAAATMSGAGGALAGGMTTLGLSAMGLGSLPVTIVAAGIGLAGAVGIHLLTQKTGLYDSIKNSVKGMVGGS